MGTSIRRGAVLGVFVGLLIIINSSSAWAIPVTLPSGKVIDLNSEQVELLKQSPGVYYVEQRPEKVINGQIRYWSLIKLPQELGGGFLIGISQNLARGLEMINAREIEDPGTAVTQSAPQGSDNTADIRPTGTKDVAAQKDWRLTIDIGYRRDDLDWNIAGITPDMFLIAPLQNIPVNILSELTWSDLEIVQLECSLEKRFQRKYRIKGVFAYGVIVDGENQDSDYAGDNRTFEFSQSTASADDGSTSDVSIGFGYDIFLLSDVILFTPLIGLSHHAQNVTMTDGIQNVSAFGWPTPLGSFSGLDSSYDASWFGPWIGLEARINLYKKNGRSLVHEFLLGIEYHEVDYNAEADWNLRSDLAHPVSFEHEADGSGMVYQARWNYFFHPQWSLNLSGKFQKWDTDAGTDRIFGALGGFAETRLNEVDWESWSVMIGTSCRF